MLEVIENKWPRVTGAPGGTRLDLLVRRKARGSESKIYLVRLAYESVTVALPFLNCTQSCTRAISFTSNTHREGDG